MAATIRRSDLILPDLSYKIMGFAFEVHNGIGSGHKESVYQKAYSLILQENNIDFKEQVYYPVNFLNKNIGKNYFDFLIEGKLIIELKKDSFYSKAHIDQVLNYLKVSKLELAILLNFGHQGVTSKRIINFNSQN